MPLNPLERIENAQDRKTITIQGRKIIISGKRATLEYLGLTPDVATSDISTTAVDISYRRKATKRARWYGDSGGSNIPETNVQLIRYAHKAGKATPGRPFMFEAVSDTGGDPDGRKVTGTLEISGAWGWFLVYMEAHRPPKSVYLKSPSGAWMKAPLLATAPA